MSLRLICGKSGTGKSEICFSEIVDRINTKNKIYMITPEQYSFATEKRLLEKFKNEAVIGAEILSFARMAHRVLSAQGKNNKKVLSKSGKEMIIYKILLKNKDKLTFLGKSIQNIDLVNRALTEFKKHNVSVEDLEKIYNLTCDELLKFKIKDMILVYSEYEKYIENTYQDENDNLRYLAECLENTDFFKDDIIYIDEFTGFTKQEYKIIEVLLKRAKQVNICISTDNLDIEGKNSDNDCLKKSKEKLQFILFK